GVRAFSIRSRRLIACCSFDLTLTAAATKPATAAAPIVVHGWTCIHARGSAVLARSRSSRLSVAEMAALASAAWRARNCASFSRGACALADVVAELDALLLLPC